MDTELSSAPRGFKRTSGKGFELIFIDVDYVSGTLYTYHITL